MSYDYKKEIKKPITNRIYGPCATITPTQAGFSVSDECLPSSHRESIFFFKKTEKKEAIQKFLDLNKEVTHAEFLEATKK